MTALLLASQLAKRPVVTLDGEAVARVKDTVFDGPAGQVTGFTLNGLGVLAGPLKRALPWSAVYALGRHAVMVSGPEALTEPGVVVASGEAARGAVLGVRVLTDAGAEVGTVLDVVVEGGTSGRVAGFRIAAAEAFDRDRREVFVPRGETLAVSGEALVIPVGACHFVADDLPSFTAQVGAFRARREPAAGGRPEGKEAEPW
ncbi:PRC-barrel domain-containing protein [Streptomyces sp. NPDC049577]|uniref:PRC-barrel domain-containing protein n=1 Tax=Streptomyces sp. NPDC049577 TaxID=3155153 RepID=UPI003430930E